MPIRTSSLSLNNKRVQICRIFFLKIVDENDINNTCDSSRASLK
jgi:hypothetical protein